MRPVLALSMLFAATLADIATTHAGQRAGMIEANPIAAILLAAGGLPAFGAVKLAAVALLAPLADRGPRAAALVVKASILGTIVVGVVAASNAFLLATP